MTEHFNEPEAMRPVQEEGVDLGPDDWAAEQTRLPSKDAHPAASPPSLGVEELREALTRIERHETEADEAGECENCHDAYAGPYFALKRIAREALVSGRSEEEEGGRPFGQPAGAPTGSSPQAVSSAAAHQAQGDEA